MGVHGLTSFIDQHSTLGQTVILTPPLVPTPPTALIVDLLAFTYAIALRDTLRGGQYQEVRGLLRKYVNYWRACNLAPEFVLDGPSEHTKLDTVLDRSQQTLNRCVQYMKASDAERATPRMQRMVTKMPTMTQATVVAELKRLKVPVHFAEGEADAATAELAQRRRGFMLSSDSDYFIFPADCLGYIPLSTMEYGGTGNNKLEYVPRKAPLQVRFKCYHHRNIAKILDLPPSFLPLFAALVGNDQADYLNAFTTTPRQPRSQRPKGKQDKQLLPYIARELSKLASLEAPPIPDGGPAPPDAQSVVLNAVLPQLGIAAPKIQMIHDLLLSADSYKLKPVTTPSPTFPLHPHELDSPYRAQCRALYLAAFKRGQLSGSVLNILKHGRVIRPGQLEMHEFASPGALLGTPVRRWTYALLADAFYDEGDLVITEVVRKGVKLVPTEVQAENMHDLIAEALGATDLAFELDKPILLGSPVLRHQLLLLAFGGASPALLRHRLWPLLIALRHNRRFILVRPWTDHDLLAAILAAHFLMSPGLVRPTLKLPTVPPREYIQRSTELTAALSHFSSLAEALLVIDRVVPAVHRLFDGQLLHGFMALGEGQVAGVLKGLGKAEEKAVMTGLRLVLA